MNTEQRTRKIEHMLKSRQTDMPELFGYRWSFHALARMKVRGIQPDWVIDALDKPGRPSPDRDVFKHVGDLASCFVNHRSRIIITIGHGTLNENPKGSA